MDQGRRRIKTRDQARLKTYRVTILPTIDQPIEVIAEDPQEAEEWADYYWDTHWDGEFVAQVEEVKDERKQKKPRQIRPDGPAGR